MRIQDTPLSSREWACQQRILLTHDISTRTRYAFEHLAAGQTIDGIIEATQSLSMGKAVEDLLG